MTVKASFSILLSLSELLKTITSRKASFFAHIVRAGVLMPHSITGHYTSARETEEGSTPHGCKTSRTPSRHHEDKLHL